MSREIPEKFLKSLICRHEEAKVSEMEQAEICARDWNLPG
jgi:hypothetical protein